MDIAFAERNFFHHVHAHHHHSGNPEENDIKAGYQNRSRIESIQIFGFVRPAQRRESPQAGREPGIKDIGFTRQLNMSAIMSVGGSLRFFDIFFAENFAVRTVPNRHLVPPPKLA